MMTAPDVLAIVRALQNAGVEVCVDGGWAVDALLGVQSREHDDLDIAAPHEQLPPLRAALAELGFHDSFRSDESEYNFVLATSDGRRVDVHSYILNSDGSNRAGITYVSEDLKGEGVIDGVLVRCIGATSLIRFHTAYDPDERDRHDVLRLCERFGLAPPAGFAG